MPDVTGRRPLASRNTRWAQALSRKLAATRLTPNMISMGSILAAAVAGASFWVSGGAEGWSRAALLVAAAAFCQVRLLCNLFDGLVAIEAGKKEPDGAFWNEFPDRVADVLILVGLGLGAGEPALGWAAAAMAILTAYTRELGRACGLPADFSGPMAKQHRMAVVTLGALASAVLGPFTIAGASIVLVAVLWIVVLGAAATALRRAIGISLALRRNVGSAPARMSDEASG